MDSDSEFIGDWDFNNGPFGDDAEGLDFIFDDESKEEVEVGYTQEESPGKTKYWVPTCEDTLKPHVGKLFATVQDGIDFYEQYAATVGFKTKLGGSFNDRSGTLMHRYVRCNKHGFSQPSKSTGKRKRLIGRVGCKAHVYLKFKGLQGYEISRMEERHNHILLQGNMSQFLNANRKLNYGHRQFMLHCARANMGPALTHRLMKECRGCSTSRGPSLQDIKNFKRDIMAYISGADAQMVLNRFLLKKKASSAFYFDYVVDAETRLLRLFWCDPIARANYAAFGDVVSFDSTYRTNKYSMVFGPFTGMDSNRKSVTFGAGLLINEDKDSYRWLFESFKRAMGKDPMVLVTDQDPAMREVIPEVFPNTRHRLCMWHIMMKVPKEVPHDICRIKEFRKKLNKAVWSYYIIVEEFELLWKEILEEFKLQENKWLKLMYKQRSSWIPAYFKDVPMGGLIRTTSISESANSFFGKFSSRHFNMVELMMQFDGAMETQRHTQAMLDMENATTTPQLKSQLQLESHAASVYTNKVFVKVQEEIQDALILCNVTKETVEGGKKVHIVEEEDCGPFQVIFDLDTQFSTCACNTLHRIGIPCKHIFTTYKYMGVKSIPDIMIKARWTKEARKLAQVHVDEAVVKECAALEARKVLMDKLWGTIYSTVGLVEDDTELIQDLMASLTLKKDKYMEKMSESGGIEMTKEAFVEMYVGVKPPKEIDVHPPPLAKNKGHRLKGSLELATSKGKIKKMRKCGRCGKVASHNRRTCTAVLDHGKTLEDLEEDLEEDSSDEAEIGEDFRDESD